MTGSSAGKESFAVASAPGQKPKITSIFDFSSEALGQLRLWLEQNPPAVGISNIIGFSQFTAQIAADNASGTTTSATYTDLTGPASGPMLSGLPDGKYVILFGCGASSSADAAQTALASVSVNAAAASDNDAAQTQNSPISSISRAITSTLAAGNNSVALKYRSTSGTATFSFRWLIALRYANK